MCITQVAYAELAVDDLEESVGFHTDVVGMNELGRENNHVNLGCGVDGRCDLVLHGGGTGVRVVALEVESTDDLDRYGADPVEGTTCGIRKLHRFSASPQDVHNIPRLGGRDAVISRSSPA